MDLPVCHPQGTPPVRLAEYFKSSAPAGPARLVVIANFFLGCNAGRREANVYSYTSTMIHARYPNVIFLSSLKGGSSSLCRKWAEIYENDGVTDMASVVPEVRQPLTVHDGSYVLRDAFFTSPYPHPSYAIIDYRGQMREKFVGPCCGYEGYYACSERTALALNGTLHEKISSLLDEVKGLYGGHADCFFSAWAEWNECSCPGSTLEGTRSRSRRLEQRALGDGICGADAETEQCYCADPQDCTVSDWADWSECSAYCGHAQRHRERTVLVPAAFGGAACPAHLTEAGQCELPVCQEQCVPRLGERMGVRVVATAEAGLQGPRDVAFTPVPGRHLGSAASGQNFSTTGEEAWVANGHGHSITIVTGIGEGERQSITRYDRGWYHYMMNITALSFNLVSDSGRDSQRDTFAYFATCQDSNNTYSGLKEPNFFMGPSLYSSSPEYKNLVRHDGGECGRADECFFLHADMLHESPSCAGIVHDPETVTAYGTVYWTIDGAVGHLVRYDFQQPHGPGLMDHSVAAVRRYPEVQVVRGPPGVHQGMVIDASDRALYVASTGSGQILRVLIDTGEYARTAREEYPIFSSRFPSFEYSIFQCMEFTEFASGLQDPSGLALADGMLFVAEYSTGDVIVFDIPTGFRVNSYSTGSAGLMGLSFAPRSGRLHGVNALTNELLELWPEAACGSAFQLYTRAGYALPEQLRPKSNATCVPNGTIPNATLFEQVHVDSGYASDNPAVQNDTMMDESAALLANRTDCEWNSSLNFDSLLLGGYLCHRCLPDNCAARDGGRCTNLQWAGYTCDNELRISRLPGGGFAVDRRELLLEPGRVYRVVVDAPGAPLLLSARGVAVSPAVEVGTLRVNTAEALPDAVVGPRGEVVFRITTPPMPSPTPAPSLARPRAKACAEDPAFPPEECSQSSRAAGAELPRACLTPLALSLAWALGGGLQALRDAVGA